MQYKGLERPIATEINSIAAFLAQRDIAALDTEDLFQRLGQRQVDLLILLGSAVLSVAEMAGKAMQMGVARRLMIVGGIGHSTDLLRCAVASHPVYHTVPVSGRPEAAILADILADHYHVPLGQILIEEQSTNCGDNARASLQVLGSLTWQPQHVLLMQDPTMQRRTHAAFAHEWRRQPTELISFAAFVPQVKEGTDSIEFLEPDMGKAWEMSRFLSLLLGEIPRLRDDASGYGPKGRGFIAHVDIPDQVLAAYEYVRQTIDLRPR